MSARRQAVHVNWQQHCSAVQETRWSGSKSKDIGCGFKIVYNGSPGTRNGVSIIVSERVRDSTAGVERFDDRLMKIVIVTLESRIHFSRHTPRRLDVQIEPNKRPLICRIKITPPNKRRVERCGPARIKWWRLRKEEIAVISHIQAAHYDEVCRKLDSRDGERFIYRLAKSRRSQADEVDKFHGVNDDQGYPLMDRKKVMQQWGDYFEVSTEEFVHPSLPQVPLTFAPVQPITAEETIYALKRMKSGEATSPDDM